MYFTGRPKTVALRKRCFKLFSSLYKELSTKEILFDEWLDQAIVDYSLTTLFIAYSFFVIVLYSKYLFRRTNVFHVGIITFMLY